MLPYTPLHHLLMAETGFPVVATSGNLLRRADGHRRARCASSGSAAIADAVHRTTGRSFARSTTRLFAFRRGRRAACAALADLRRCRSTRRGGDAPTILAVGGHLKNTVALAVGPQVFISQHIGDLETEPANAAFPPGHRGFVQNLYGARPDVIAADLHPEYLSTKFAREIVAQASLPAGSGGIPAAWSQRGSKGMLREPAGWKPCATSASNTTSRTFTPAWPKTNSKRRCSGFPGTARVTDLDGTIWGGEFFPGH